METLKFKTNIKCSGCLSKITPVLNENVGEDNWDININEPNKTLTVEAEGVSAQQIIAAVEKAGYTAQSI